jgi:hypothetical protein
MKFITLASALALTAGCASQTQNQPAGDALAQRLVSEDDNVRIEELRVRGQTQRLTVQPKGSESKAYEILPPAAGSNPSQHKDAAGQRVWQVLSF